MKILILGGAGFLGNNLIRYLLNKKLTKITVVDSLSPEFKSNLKSLSDILPKIKFIKGDIRNQKLMERVVKKQNIIFNCAGQTSHPLSLTNPILDASINCIGNLTLLEAVRKNNPTAKIIFTGSSTLIGKAFDENVDEKHSEKPLDIYSANKGVAEKYYYIYHKIHGLKTLTLRFANIYGPYGKGFPQFGFINYFIDLAIKNQQISIYGKGNQIRNVMYAEDAAALLYLSAKNDDLFGDIYFAVHREHYSVLEIAKEIISVFKKGRINKIKWPNIREKIEINNVFISGAKLFYKTKWEPEYNLRKGLEKIKDVVSKNKSFG